MSNETKTPKRPTHAIFQVVDNGEKTNWNRVGAAWPNKDGKGLYLKFDAYPIVGRIQVREITKQDEAGSAEGAQ